MECNTGKRPWEGGQKEGNIFVLSKYESDDLYYLFQQYQAVPLS